MKDFNLSEWVLTHRAFTGFLMALLLLGGIVRLFPAGTAGRPGIHVSGDGRQNPVSWRHRAGSGATGDRPAGKENSGTAEPGLLAQLLETRRIGDFCHAS